VNITTLLDIVADVDPDRVAVGDARDGLTLAQLRDLVARAATVLQEQPDRPLLFAGTATAAFPVALFAAATVGRPFAPISYRLAAEPLNAIVADQTPTTLLAEDRTAADLDAGLAVEVERALDFLGRARQAERWDGDPGHDPEDVAVLLHTSGTTGKPKVAVLRHRHLTSYVLNGTEMLAAGRDEAALVSVPPYHIAGISAVLTGVYSGRRIVHLEAFTPEAWVDAAAAEDITHAMVVPTMLGRILDVLEARGESLPAMKAISYGGGRMPPAVIDRAL